QRGLHDRYSFVPMASLVLGGEAGELLLANMKRRRMWVSSEPGRSGSSYLPSNTSDAAPATSIAAQTGLGPDSPLPEMGFWSLHRTVARTGMTRESGRAARCAYPRRAIS